MTSTQSGQKLPYELETSQYALYDRVARWGNPAGI